MKRWRFFPHVCAGACDRREQVEHPIAVAQMELALEAVKPSRPRAKPRHNPERGARLQLERGAEVLAAPDRRRDRPRTWCVMVRIYYRSEGGEILCFDAGPMNADAAAAMVKEYESRAVDGRTKIEKMQGKPITRACGLATDAIDAESFVCTYHSDARKIAPRPGARLVTLPSTAHDDLELQIACAFRDAFRVFTK